MDVAMTAFVQKIMNIAIFPTEAFMHRLGRVFFQLAAVVIVIFLGCVSPARAISIPINGKVLNSAETFTGMATVYFSGGGKLTLTTNGGVACKGDFIHVSQQEGTGTVSCEDGRLGSFNFVTAGFSGSGSGRIGNESFDFRIGK
ncbi:MAG: hypothetical protein AAGU21_09015 [Solidesulfovibrio sp.]|uniref:hypothetical protein n=1 Tax=Solidesulfovibrio sp. TaxID=2910990 RepID=UPI00315980AF